MFTTLSGYSITSNNHLKKKLADIEREIINLGDKAPHSLILVDRSVPQNVNV